MFDVAVMDNFLSITEQQKIFNVINTPEFSWEYTQNSCGSQFLNKRHVIDKNTIDSPILVHQLSVKNTKKIIYIDILNLIYQLETLKQKPYMNRIVRLKVNKHLKEISFPNDCHSYPHIDSGDKVESLLYYVNDSDGDTFIFNETIKDISIDDINLTINKRISPKQGRAILFDGNYLHAGSPPRNHDMRIIINAVFRKE